MRSEKGKIVAIGGGEIGRPREKGKGNYPVETTPIDREIIKLTGKKNPRLLFLPTASGDSEGYCEVMKKHFGERLGCKIDFLYTVKKKMSFREMRLKVLESDIIYVGGGNTLNMLNIWREMGLDDILREAYNRGIVLSGVSAGANCWFRYASSDSRPKMGKDNYGFIRINGLDLVPLTISPHHTREQKREKALINIMRRTPGVGIALDDCSALEIVDGNYRIISSKKGANAHLVYWNKGKLNYRLIEKSKMPMPLEQLGKFY